jgi:hypothetical protein
MIREPITREFVVDLDGPEGNAFELMGLVKGLAWRYGLPFDDIIEEMKSSDYTNLVKTIEKYFGEYVIFETSNKELLND